MTGLAIVGGEAPEAEVCRYLAKKANMVAAADSGLITAENAGIVPDWIIGDMDSLDDPRRLQKYPAETVKCFSHDKDFTDTELALGLLREKGCDEVWIAGGGGGRLDHLLALFFLFERKKFPARWVTLFDDIYCLGESGELKMILPEKTTVSVLPLGPGGGEAESCGLKWNLNGLIWEKGSFGISNRTEDRDFSIRVKKGRFMVIVPLSVSRAGFIHE